jgi:hypothetical protein
VGAQPILLLLQWISGAEAMEAHAWAVLACPGKTSIYTDVKLNWAPEGSECWW